MSRRCGDTSRGISMSDRENGGGIDLSSQLLFSALGPDQLGQLCQSMRRHRLEDGQVLFHRGQQASRFYLLESGRVVLKRISDLGHEKIIEIVQPGKTFAEAVMFMGQTCYPVTTVSVGESVVLSFSNAVFKDLLRRSPETCFRMLADLSMRLHRWVEEVDQLTLQNATFRIVSYLQQLGPPVAEGELTIELPAPKQLIASRLSITPETFSRITNELRRRGLVEMEGARVHIPDVGALRRHCEEMWQG
ncbi:MAG: Crp/Fnr family transcriptional regulator [Gammaproteobacteria bacterium]|nr:MAG: Crp/Fnr family transcriptional regulator [Gammaproteobacteria bacterium]